jgi:hypothetical protein
MHGLGKWRHQPSPLLLSLFRTSQKVLCAPAETTNDVHAYTVKKIPRRPNIFGDDRGICATGVSKPGNQWFANANSTRSVRARFALCLRCNHWVTNAKVSPFPPRSRCGIFSKLVRRVGRIRANTGIRVPGGMVLGANGDPTLRFGNTGGAERCGRSRMSCTRQLRVLRQVCKPRRPQIRGLVQSPSG